MPTLLVTVVVLVYTLLALAGNNGDPRSFVTYDGHYSYQIAVRFFESPDGIASLPQDYRFREEAPSAYRYQRIFYPFLARLMAFGQANLIPWALIILNILAISGGTWVTEEILVELGASRWYALAYGLYGSQLVGLRTDLNEPLAHALVQVAILVWMRRRLLWTILFFSLAALTKEVALLFLAGFVIYSFIKREWVWTVGLSAAALPYLVYQIILWFWLGDFGFSTGQPFHLLPLGGWFEAAQDNVVVFLLISIPIFPISIFPTFAGFFIVLRDLNRRFYHPFVFSILFFGLFILFLPFLTFREPVSMLRVTQGLAISLLLYGALVDSKRILNYSLLWITTNVFLLKGVA
jgi:hypothetical protein